MKNLDHRVRWIIAVLLAGLAAGIAGGMCHLLLKGVEFAVFGTLVSGNPSWATQSSWPRKVFLPLIPAVVGGIIWWRLRRTEPDNRLDTVEEMVAGKVASARTCLDAITQITVVGAGASIGREAAPRQIAAWISQQISFRLRLFQTDAKCLVAAGAGGGLAAVYNTPLAGLAMTWFLLFPKRYRSVRRFFSCLIINLQAAVIAWPFVGRKPVYPFSWGAGVTSLRQFFWFLFAVGLTVIFSVLCGRGFSKLMRVAKRFTPSPACLVLTIPLATCAVGVLALWFPELTGNGANQVWLLLSTAPNFWLIVALGLIKTVATAATLNAGAAGGLLTPSLAVGASVGAIVAHLTGFYSSNVQLAASLALIGLASFFAVTNRSGIFGAVFAIELCHPEVGLCIFILASTLPAWKISTFLDKKFSR